MVLHNNKWDKRAKTRYLKKHDLVPVKVQEGPKPKWTGAESDSEEHSGSQDEASGSDTEPNAGSQTPHKEEKVELEGADGIKLDDGPVEFEFEHEQNQEDADIIAQHIAQFKFEAPKSKNVHYTGKQEDFDEIRESIAHGKLTRDIKRRFGKAKYQLPDEDEDDFWESTASSSKPKPKKVAETRKVEVDKDHEAFLDNLLG